MASAVKDTHVKFRQIWRNPLHFFAFGFGAGTLPKCPGTWGTVVAIPLYLLIARFSLPIYLAILLIAAIVGIWFCSVAARDFGVHDHPGIVWDEIVGYGVTMIALPTTVWWILLGFIFFRLFDIWKPWPIRWFDQRVKGGLGIMVDDILAGLYAWIILQIVYFYFS